MTKKDLKKKLWDVANKKHEIKAKIAFYEDLIGTCGFKSYELSDLPKGTSPSDPVFRAVVNNERYRKEIARLQQELDEALEWFNIIIQPLSQWKKTILTLRYLNGIRWDYIEMYVPYSRRQAIRLYNNALDKIIKHINTQ